MALVASAALLAGCALTPVNYQGTDSGRYSDGRVWSYSGGKFADQKDGKGIMAWSDGDRFEGEWIAYKGPQRGTMTYRDGNVYSGEVAPDYTPHGRGRKVWKDGGCSYEGDWADGRQHGEGVYRCPNGYTRTGSYRNGKAQGRSVVVWPDGGSYDGLWSAGQREDPAATLRFAGGNEYKGPFVADKRDGAGWFRNAAQGREYRHFYRADTLMASVPIGGAPGACSAVPAGWLLVAGECGSAGLDGDIVLASPDGMRRFKATYRGGAVAGVADQVELSPTLALWVKGTARAPGDFASGQRFAAVTGADGKGAWQQQFDGTLAGTTPARGRCLFRGQWEACEHASDGRRVDALSVARAEAEQRAEEERRADERRAEAEERARARAEAERRAEQEADDRAEARAAMQQAITGGLASLQQSMAQLQAQDRRTAQLIAQANRERADRETQRQAEARRERERAEAERDEARRRQAAAAQRSQQAALQTQQLAQAQAQQAALAQQAAAQQRQEAERREQARREQEAAAARRAQEQREAEAERKRREEERAAQERAEAESRKAEAERKRAEEAARKQAEEAARKPALAFCWQSDKGYWNCDGRVQETLIGEKGDKGLDEQLSLVGCKQPRRLTTNGEVTLTSTRGKQRTGHVYDCGYKLDAGDTGPVTWNRDIRRWWRDIPW